MTYTIDYILDELDKTNLGLDSEFYLEMTDEFMNSFDGNFLGGNYIYENGATKLVIIPSYSDMNFVIKIPFSGGMYETYDDEEFYCGESYRPFNYGNNIEGNWDYCAVEAERYLEAERHGLAQYFAKTELIGYVNDYPVYIQPKCMTMRAAAITHTHSVDENTATIKKTNHYIPINVDWLTDFRLCYGDEELIHFLDFIKQHGWDDDLRNDNIGYYNNKPVLIDYSGYSEEEHDSEFLYNNYESSSSFS